MKYLLIFLFILGALFINASHIPACWLGSGKPTHSRWKLYGVIDSEIWVLIFIPANIIL